MGLPQAVLFVGIVLVSVLQGRHHTHPGLATGGSAACDKCSLQRPDCARFWRPDWPQTCLESSTAQPPTDKQEPRTVNVATEPSRGISPAEVGVARATGSMRFVVTKQSGWHRDNGLPFHNVGEGKVSKVITKFKSGDPNNSLLAWINKHCGGRFDGFDLHTHTVIKGCHHTGYFDMKTEGRERAAARRDEVPKSRCHFSCTDCAVVGPTDTTEDRYKGAAEYCEEYWTLRDCSGDGDDAGADEAGDGRAGSAAGAPTSASGPAVSQRQRQRRNGMNIVGGGRKLA